jgi:D-glycero-D-manno-heptose 1,7-bisphosphate phosphatase
VSQWKDFHPLPGVGEAIAALNRAGKRGLVVTNQRGVALGLYTTTDVERLHEQLQQWLAGFSAHIDAFYYCPHDKDVCRCRKPLPGLFEQAVDAYPDIGPANSVMIGDSLSDIEAGTSFGMPTVFIEGDPDSRKSGYELARTLADACALSLQNAVSVLTGS